MTAGQNRTAGEGGSRRRERLATLVWPEHPSTWREVPGRLAPTLVTIARLTAGAIIAYLITLLLTNGAVDLTGPLTALLVMQASAFSTLKMGAVRVGAVLAGVLIATLLSTWIGLTWWSLGAAIAISLLLAYALRLGEQALETPISAMLILGVTDPNLAAETRVLNTLIGACVGVAFNVLYPPALPTRPAGRSVREVAESTAAPLEAAADAFAEGPVSHGQVEGWLAEVGHRGTGSMTQATAAVASLKDSRRFNPRALGTADVEPVLASGLRTLERCLLAIRALFAVLLAELPTGNASEDPYGEELRVAFSVVLHDVADCLRSFGELVVAEAEEREEEAERALYTNLDVLRETRAILTELILVNARDDTSAWMLRGSILASVEQVLDQLNLEERARARQSWREEQLRKPLSQLPPLVQAALPHPDRPYPRGLPVHMQWRRSEPADPTEAPQAIVRDHTDPGDGATER